MFEIEVRKIDKYKEVTITSDNTKITTNLLDEEESYDLALFLIEAAENLANATYVESPIKKR